MATVAGSKRLLDISGNNVSTAVSLTASGTLLDTNGAAGASSQVLSSTGSGVDWVDASSVIGGPYLPLTGGTLTGGLTVNGDAIASGIGVGTSTIYSNSVNLNNSGTLRIGNAEFLAKAVNDLSIYQGKIRVQQGGKVLVGVTVNQTQSKLTSRQNGSSIEFGHLNQGGKYYGTLGAMSSSGSPFIAFSADNSSANTFTTRGAKGFVISQDTDISGDLIFSSVPLVNTANQGLDEKIRITSTGNIGIGTNNPGTKLHIGGGIITVNDGTGITYYEGTKINSYDANGYDIIGREGLTFSTVSADKDIILSPTGNVGIGTTNPSQKLTVQGNTLSVGNITAYGDGSNSSTLSNTGYLQLRNSGSTNVNIRSNGSSYFNGGNVGVGTASPGFALDVHGDSTVGVLSVKNAANGRDTFRSENATGTRTVNIGNDGSGHGIILIRNSSGTTTNYISGSGNSYFNSGNVGIGTTSPNNFGFLEKVLNISAGSSSSTTLQQAGIVISGSSDADDADDFGYLSFTNYQSAITNDRVAEIRALKNGTNVDTGEFAFYTSSGSGPAERMRIDASGNVGIGTTSPGYTLDVNGSLHSTNINIADGIYHEGDTNTYMQFHSSDQWRVVTGGTERLEVNNTQVTVANNLQVGGSIYASQYIYHTGDTNTYMRFPSNDTISWNTAGSERMRINSSGNIGIGTTAPSYKLHVAGNTYANGSVIGSSDLWLRDQSSAYSTELKMQNNTHTIGIDYQNNETLRFITRSGVTTVPITFAMRTGTINAANFTQTSDERLKTKISDLSCDNIDVSWKSFEMKDNEGEYRTGVVAQELEQKHPEFVNTNEEGFKSVKYIDLLIAKIAELEARLEKLEK